MFTWSPNNSNVLTGNDWLKMAGMLRIRLDPVWDVHKDVPIGTDGGMLRVHMCQPAGRKAVQCLIQSPMLNGTGELSDSGSAQESDSDAESDTEPESDAELVSVQTGAPT